MGADTKATVAQAMPRLLRWWSPHDLSMIELKLLDVVERWADDWRVREVSVQCANAWQDESLRRATPATWYPSGFDADGWPSLWCAAPLDDVQRIVEAAMFGRSVAEATPGELTSTPIASEVARKAAESLIDRLLEELGAVVWHGSADARPAANPSSEIRRWSGAVAVQLRLGGDASTAIGLLVSGASLKPSKPSRPVPIATGASFTVAEVLSHHLFTMRAMLNDVEITMGELLELRPGDIVMTPHRLSSALSVESVDDPMQGRPSPLFAAQLGRRGERMALALRPAAELSISQL